MWIKLFVSSLRTLCPTFGPEEFSSFLWKVLHFTFKSVIHFEFICIKGARFRVRFTFLLVDFQLLQHHLFKRLSLVHWFIYICIFDKNHLALLLGLFLNSQFWSMISVPIFLPRTQSLNYYSYIMFLNLDRESSHTILLFKIVSNLFLCLYIQILEKFYYN